jgi:DnaJ-domain-containing protein 1/Tfp pilus assembly protein PilZ
MTHRIRLLARYAADFVVYVQGDVWPEPKRFQAKDISSGGLFIRSNEMPEMFAEILLRIVLPWGGDLKLQGRAVHILTPEKARGRGSDAGIGIEFLDPTAAEQKVIGQLVAWARAGDPGRCVPIMMADAAATEVNPMLGYVLAAVDGKRDIHDIADTLQLAPAATESMLIQLNDLGVVHLGDSATVALMSLRAAGNSRAGQSSPAPKGSLEESAEIDRATFTDIGAVEKIWARMSEDHYTFLGVTATAAQGEVRAAYLALSKQFHPENPVPPAFQRKLHEIFDRLTEAYSALSSSSLRKQYDAYLRRARSIAPGPSSTKQPASTRTPITFNLEQAQATTAPLAARAFIGGAARALGAIRSAVGAGQERSNHKAEAAPSKAGGKATASMALLKMAADPAHLDMVRKHLTEAVKACDDNDMEAAARSLALLEALEWERPELRKIYDDVARKVAVALAPTYLEQARYEMRQQKWKQATRSWLKVCLGRPNDVESHRSAAEAILLGNGDLRKARDLAQKAVELAPRDALSRRLLGHVYLEAKMYNNARRELEIAVSLNGMDESSRQLLRRAQECAA